MIKAAVLVLVVLAIAAAGAEWARVAARRDAAGRQCVATARALFPNGEVLPEAWCEP